MDPVTFLVVGIVFEGIFYGFYCVIFGLYLQTQCKRKDTFNKPFIYALTAIFILCTIFLAVNLAQVLLKVNCIVESSQTRRPASWTSVSDLTIGVYSLYACIDLISQGVLIYRCWMMWRQPWIVFVPVILTVACLGTSLRSLVFLIENPGFDRPKGPTGLPPWFRPVVMSFFSMSLVVNASVTGLLVFKILIVYRELEKSRTHTVHANRRGSRYCHPIVPILVLESGLPTFFGQLVQIILCKYKASVVAFGIVAMLYGISSTIACVRFAMGLSCDNDTSRMAISHPILESNDTRSPEVELTRTQAHTQSETTHD